MVGQIFVFFGFRFEILERHRNQITKLKITPIADQAEQPEAAEGAVAEAGGEDGAKAIVKVAPKSDPSKKSGGGGAAGAAA
jgi:hypothetical protein